jgi:two-component system sensor histidine kinase UhpB
LGIYGMHERVALLGGRLAIESRPGHGTSLFVQVPLPGPELANG